MTHTFREKTTVVVIGCGASGLTVASLLSRLGIPCVVLERRGREYVEKRQRAGIVELRAVRMFNRWALGDVIVGPANEGTVDLRIDGVSHPLTAQRDDPHSPPPRFCPQQALVRNLLAKLLERGGDLRFEASEVSIAAVATDQPVVSYLDSNGTRHDIACEFVAGCDGDLGVSRSAIPAAVLRSYEQDFGVSWVSILAETAPPARLVIAISEQGYACHISRGPSASRFYLQCRTTDGVEDWPDERVWEQLRVRMGDPSLPVGAIPEKQIVSLRSAVHEPMSHGRLFLVGDAAHIVIPVGGKGMNLALRDAELLALALEQKVHKADDAGLRAYSAACLRRIWKYQGFILWLADMFHDAGDDSRTGAFRRRLARARLDHLLTSRSLAQVYSELMAGED